MWAQRHRAAMGVLQMGSRAAGRQRLVSWAQPGSCGPSSETASWPQSSSGTCAAQSLRHGACHSDCRPRPKTCSYEVLCIGTAASPGLVWS